MKVAVGLRRVAAGKRTSGRRAAQIAGDAHCQLQVAALFYKRNADITVIIIVVFWQLPNSWSYLLFDI